MFLDIRISSISKTKLIVSCELFEIDEYRSSKLSITVFKLTATFFSMIIPSVFSSLIKSNGIKLKSLQSQNEIIKFFRELSR